MAGKSGLNLTRDDEPAEVQARYGALPPACGPPIFGHEKSGRARRGDGLGAGLGIDLFTGSTGRVFPVG